MTISLHKIKPRGMDPVLWWMREDKWTLDIETGCWLSHASVNMHGYCLVKKNNKTCYLHRLVLEYVLGRRIKDGKQVNHSCYRGQYGCINPSHLYEGTQQDNLEDMRGIGHQVKGESHGQSKVTEEDVWLIRNHYAPQGWTQQQIGQIFDLTFQSVSHIVNNKTWREI